ncbi:class I SAM-dependent methyltransferase [Bacillus atrophaeus]|uniref:class I SAM-dependent methyltransferase n=1 Tax=Bacillus atrophaeus TaxID=1452 RepID=UPI00216321C2|nr:class I SAM-dependent methyltransferase [Bacillus atrophaeus]
MEIETIVRKSEANRIQAQTWFSHPEKSKVSFQYDERETSSIRSISIETFLSFYSSNFNREPFSILDIGCGQGQVIQYLNNRSQEVELTGIDSSAQAISSAKKLGINAAFICSNVENIMQYVSKKKYDVIFIHLCFGLFKNPIDVVNTLIHLLSDESCIYIVDLDRNSLRDGLNTAQSREEEAYLKDQYRASLTLAEFKQLLCLVTKKQQGLSFHVGNSFIGGFDETSSQFFSLIRNKNLQFALRAGVVEQVKQSNMPALLHGWIIKNKRYT